MIKQYSILAIMALTTGVAIVSCALRWEYERAQKQSEHIARIRAAGADVDNVSYPNLVTVTIQGQVESSEIVWRVKELHGVRSVILGDSSLASKDIHSLMASDNINRVVLSGDCFDGDLLSAVPELAARRIAIFSRSVPRSALEHLLTFPVLKELTVHDAPLTTADVTLLKKRRPDLRLIIDGVIVQSGLRY